MIEDALSEMAREISSLHAVVITAMPDCLLYGAWAKSGQLEEREEVASYFGDLIRSNRRALKSLGSWSSEMQVTIEAIDSLIVLRELNENFICGCIFERSVPLGMVRLQVKRLLEQLASKLPKLDSIEQPRAVRVIEFLHRYAPDPHAILARVALRTKIAVTALSRPESLDPAQTQQIEDVAAKLLGLDKLNI
jgi:predicted regulator of Ras-like GTPase activity (Roadblock/LC7/MglB family)